MKMKTFVSALALGLVALFAAPAFASTTGAYVGDMLSDETAAQAPDVQAENKPMTRKEARLARREARKQVY
jgi:hypothetical protein